MQLHADTHTHTKDSKTFLFPTVELFQLARNTDITKKNKIPGERTFPDIKSEPDEVSYVCICL